MPGSEELLASLVAGPEGRAATKTLTGVVVAMEKPGALKEINAAVHEASASIDKCLAGVAAHRFDVATIERLIDLFDNPQAWNHVAGWDAAAERYLGAGAALPGMAGSGAGSMHRNERPCAAAWATCSSG